MYDHSVLVKKLALKIAKSVPCNVTLVAIGALLHDIGKTKKASAEVLHHDHETFNLQQSKPLLKALGVMKQKTKLEKIISHTGNSTELKVIEDADALALYYDKKLYTLFLKWSIKQKLYYAITRKIKKFDKLHFPVSRKLGKPALNKMLKDWNVYLKKKKISIKV